VSGQPQSLAGRRVAVYVGGSVAAFKAAEVVTLLRKRGGHVRVAMTAGAQHFVTPLTMQSLSGNPVAASVWEAPIGGETAAGHGMEHLALSAWCEVQVAVAATADLIAKLALGLADDAVTTTALACHAPLLVAPAMETAMWQHAATQANVATLRARGAVIVGPEVGRLASGREGAGRMVEAVDIVAAVENVLRKGSSLAPAVQQGFESVVQQRWLTGTRVVITSGGTREPIDPVRYIGNRSSGKMGLALAREALRLGARVTLVTAAQPPPPQPNLDVVQVETAAEMLDAVRGAVADARVLIMAAAVADYRPAQVAERKIKKSDQGLRVDLVPTVDILRALRDEHARHRSTHLCVVGFAAETEDLLANARHKLDEKGLDLIVANDVGHPGVGMGSDDNAVTIIGPGGVLAAVERAPKPEIARAVFEAVRVERGLTG
jgi:phosphopantothenoylcysteine decarboxylase / phosphopantothenate---cysteine ligase